MISTSPINTSVESLARHQLVAPVLLFLTGHRPLAFAAAHVLALGAPVADLLGQRSVTQWVKVLSTAEGLAELEAALHAANASIV